MLAVEVSPTRSAFGNRPSAAKALNVKASDKRSSGFELVTYAIAFVGANRIAFR